MPFDGIITKAVACELQSLAPCKVEKITQPDKNTIVFCVYSNKERKNIHISLDAQNYRMSISNINKPLPANPYNFCMLLRKHLVGLRIQSFVTNSLERIITICFEGFDDIDELVSKKLVIELMGKHCNAILLDESGYIIDSLRHISPNDETHRNIYPKTRYALPLSDKVNFLNIDSLDQFSSIIKEDSTLCADNLSSIVANSFIGLSNLTVEHHLSLIDSSLTLDETISKLFDALTKLVNNIDTLKCNIAFGTNSKNKKDFCLIYDDTYNCLDITSQLENFYQNREDTSVFLNKKNTLSGKIQGLYKKYLDRLNNMDNKLKECENMDTYRIYGELITTNLYKLPTQNIESITLENYYDNNNEITIKLDKKYLPSINAKRFFKKYSKLKNTLVIVGAQKKETLLEIKYIETLIYQLDNSSTTDDLHSIEQELLNTNIIDLAKKINIKEKNKKKQISKSNKSSTSDISFAPIKYEVENYTLLVGRNNVENDYLTLKHASKSDIWFHVKDFPGSHCVLVLNGLDYPSIEVLSKCASIAAYNSKCKDSSSVLVDYCPVKFVKKPSKSRPGMVIYTDNKTLCVDSKI